MTVIVATRFKDSLVFGSDKLVVNEDQRLERKKLFVSKNSILGISGKINDLEFFSEESRKSFSKTLSIFFQTNISYKDKLQLFKEFSSDFNKLLEINNILRHVYSIEEKLYLKQLVGIIHKGVSSYYYDNRIGEFLIKSRFPMLLTPKGFKIENGVYFSNINSSFDYVEAKVEEYNRKFPEHCSGLEILSLNSKGVFRKIQYKKPILN